MDNGNVAEVTSFQSAIILLQFGRSPEKLMACIFPDYMLSVKFGRNCGSSSLVKNSHREFCKVHRMTAKLNPKNRTQKVPHACTY